MKRLLPTLFLLIGLAAAQATHAQGIKFGLRAGFNGASVVDVADDPAGSDQVMQPGFHIAGMANISIPGPLAIQPEIMFTRRGLRFEDENNDENRSISRIDHLMVPALAQIQLGGGPVKFYLNAGPEFGYWLSATQIEEVDGEEVANEDVDLDQETGNGDNVFKRFEVGAAFGFGVMVPLGPITLMGDFRADFGFTGQLNDEALPADGDNPKNAAGMIGVGILYGI